MMGTGRQASHRYRTLAEESEALLREKASKFVAYAFPIADEQEAKDRLAALAAAHHTSRHVCYAYVLGYDGAITRNSDAGEPSGTAGRPMLRQLSTRDLTNAMVVVVRYFGGTLLGKAGLVRAYGGAAGMALDANTVVEHRLFATFALRCGYPVVERVKQEVLAAGGEVKEGTYAHDCSLRITLPLDGLGLLEEWKVSGTPVTVQQLP